MGGDVVFIVDFFFDVLFFEFEKEKEFVKVLIGVMNVFLLSVCSVLIVYGNRV